MKIGLFRHVKPTEEFRTKMLIIKLDRKIRHLERENKALRNKIGKRRKNEPL
jgi:hypothetical protein